jgi:hypothetical protein
MTRTMALLEQRITMTEDRLANVVAYSRGMVEVPTVPAYSSIRPYEPATSSTLGSDSKDEPYSIVELGNLSLNASADAEATHES